MAVCLPLVLSGCILFNPQDYPANWSRLETAPSPRTCPIIAGLYGDIGEPSPECGGREDRHFRRNCKLLSFNFFSGDEEFMETDPHDDPLHKIFPEGVPTHMEIAQPNNDKLEIVAWSRTVSEQRMLRRAVLSMHKGDFSCSPEGLRLKRRTGIRGVLLTVGFFWEDRTFNRSEDGFLIMNSENRGFLCSGGLIPVAGGGNRWIRWRANPNSAP